MVCDRASSHSDPEQLREFVAAGESEIQRLDRASLEIARQRDLVMSKIKQWRNDLSPTRRLPPEILAEIFLLWVQQNSYSSCLLLNTPFVLAQVCSTWRKLVYNTPSLWTEIHLVRRDSKSDQFITHDWIDMFNMYLDRSKVLPIFVTLSTNLLDPAPKEFPRFFEALRPHISRIRSLKITSPISICNILKSLPSAMVSWSVLRTISFTFWDTDEPVAESHLPFTTFSNAPQLREVELGADGEFSERSLRKMALPWSQITKLNRRGLFDRGCKIILQAPALEHCFLRTAFPWTDTPGTTSHAPVQIYPALKSFVVSLVCGDEEDDSLESTARFFQPLNMPALTTLEITSSRSREVGVAEEWIDSLYSRSGSTLTHLCINNIKVEDGGLTRILGHLPALESLRAFLTHIANTDEIFLALRYRETSSISSGHFTPSGPSPLSSSATSSVTAPLVPRLHTIEIFEGSLPRGSFLNQDVIIDMILSRWWSDEASTNVYPAVSRWKRVSFVWGNKTVFDQAQLAQLVRCREEGLDVCVHGMPTAIVRAQ